MKILLHDYAGHPFQTQLSRELARRGHIVTHAYGSGLLTPQGDLEKRTGDAKTLEFLPVRLHPDYRKFKYSFWRRRAMELKYGRGLISVLTGRPVDVVMSGNMPTEPQRLLQRCCQQTGIRFVPWVQDFYGIAVDRLVRKRIPLLGPVVGAYYKWMDRRTFRAADHIVAITEDFVPLLEDSGVPPQKVTTIPNWAVLEELPLRAKDNEWARAHDLHDKITFLYSGTLAMKHNPALLRDLAVELRNVRSARVVVVSEGPGRDWLEAERERLDLANLILLPFQPFSALPSVMGSADVLVAVLEPDAGVFSVPSKVLSYLCAGRALLLAIPAANQAARLVRELEAGETVEPTDAAGFLAAAARLLEDPERRLACGKRARAYAETAFDIEIIGDRFEAILLPPAP